MPTIEIEGEEILDREAKEFGTGAHVTVPKDWRGADIKVIRLAESTEQSETEEALDLFEIEEPHIESHDPAVDVSSHMPSVDSKPSNPYFIWLINRIDEGDPDTVGCSILDLFWHMCNEQDHKIVQVRDVIKNLIGRGDVYQPEEHTLKALGDADIPTEGDESEEINVDEVFLKSETDDGDSDAEKSMPVAPENENVWRDESPAENQTQPPEDNPSVAEIEEYHINTHKRTVETEFENIFSESEPLSESMKTLIQRIDDADPDSKGAPVLDVYSYAYYEYGFDIDKIQSVMHKLLCDGYIYSPSDYRVVVLDDFSPDSNSEDSERDVLEVDWGGEDSGSQSPEDSLLNEIEKEDISEHEFTVDTDMEIDSSRKAAPQPIIYDVITEFSKRDQSGEGANTLDVFKMVCEEIAEYNIKHVRSVIGLMARNEKIQIKICPENINRLIIYNK